jgi:hypothetical protein
MKTRIATVDCEFPASDYGLFTPGRRYFITNLRARTRTQVFLTEIHLHVHMRFIFLCAQLPFPWFAFRYASPRPTFICFLLQLCWWRQLFVWPTLKSSYLHLVSKLTPVNGILPLVSMSAVGARSRISSLLQQRSSVRCTDMYRCCWKNRLKMHTRMSLFQLLRLI